jgi:hypothetical protein
LSLHSVSLSLSLSLSLSVRENSNLRLEQTLQTLAEESFSLSLSAVRDRFPPLHLYPPLPSCADLRINDSPRGVFPSPPHFPILADALTRLLFSPPLLFVFETFSSARLANARYAQVSVVSTRLGLSP